jgi:hypothetical protein
MIPILANVTVPILFPQPLLMLVALLPIVVVETLALRRRLGVDYRQVFAANLVSTLFGIPLAFLNIPGSTRR